MERRHEPRIEVNLRFDAGHPFGFERGPHRTAQQLRRAPHQRIDVRIDGVVLRRDHDARAVASHLMRVFINLREPVLIHDLRPVLRLDLRQHVPVAIVVVTDIRAVQLRRTRAFVRRARRLLEPVADDVVAVGVEAGDEEEDGVVEDRASLIVAARRQAMHQARPHLRRRHFRGMLAERHEHDRPPFGRQRVDLLRGEAPRVGHLPGDFLVAVQFREILRRRDRQQNERPAQRAFAEHLQLDAIRLLGKLLVVGDFVGPHRVFAIGCQLEPEMRSGRGNSALGLDERRQRQREAHRDMNGSHGQSLMEFAVDFHLPHRQGQTQGRGGATRIVSSE